MLFLFWYCNTLCYTLAHTPAHCLINVCPLTWLAQLGSVQPRGDLFGQNALVRNSNFFTSTFLLNFDSVAALQNFAIGTLC